MVVIRLARVGAKHDPKYRITVADSRRYVTGKFIEILGTYIPSPKGQQQKVVLNTTKAQEWISKGAQLSDTMHNFMVHNSVIQGKKKNVLPKKNYFYPIAAKSKPIS